MHRPSGEIQISILSFYVDDGFFHGKATNKGIRYNQVLDILEMSTDRLVKDKELY